ncbi:MAG: hypothetical protein K0S71_409 [Clostridia bacterium]|jgi:hypothetical protein|nr:hypothetical protein [Clostridia bacterium]
MNIKLISPSKSAIMVKQMVKNGIKYKLRGMKSETSCYSNMWINSML